METYYKPAEHVKGNVERSVETFTANTDQCVISDAIDDLEDNGWNFIDSREEYGFVHLYFTRFDPE